MRSLRTIAFLALLAALAFLPGTALAQGQALAELASSLAGAQAPIAVSTATTTELVPKPTALSPGGGLAAVYVMGHEVVAAGTGNIQFVYGTGTACATGQVPITGAYTLTAQARIHGGGGYGPEWVLPPGNALCVVTSAAVGMNGFVSYRVK